MRSQIASLEETHVISPEILNTFRAGFSRAAWSFAPDDSGSVSGQHFVCHRIGPGGIVIGGGVTTTGGGAITSAGPNNASNVWNRRNLFTYSDGVQIIKGRHQITRRRLVPADAGKREHRIAPAWASQLRKFDHISCKAR